MREFKTVSLADQVFDRLENDIIFGVYPRGEIITELKLVEQLGVSRTPIREALRRLEQERLIAESGKGSVVLGITPEDLVDIMNIRENLEGLAAGYATMNATPEELNELAHILDLQDFYYNKWDTERLRQSDDEFHNTIARLCKRNVIIDTLIPLLRKTRRYRRLALEDKNRTVNTLQEHKAIYRAIASGDGVEAMELIGSHIRNAKNHMIRSVKTDG